MGGLLDGHRLAAAVHRLLDGLDEHRAPPAFDLERRELLEELDGVGPLVARRGVEDADGGDFLDAGGFSCHA